MSLLSVEMRRLLQCTKLVQEFDINLPQQVSALRSRGLTTSLTRARAQGRLELADAQRYF